MLTKWYDRRYYVKPQSCSECQGVNTLTLSSRLNLNLFVPVLVIFLQLNKKWTSCYIQVTTGSIILNDAQFRSDSWGVSTSVVCSWLTKLKLKEKSKK